ncbi:MAG: alpha/beta hydrolase [Hyphomicrobiaceae bacterium]|nr:alpha/beta hydrolase [Hyphomicrobiaceae bacterium]
MTSAQSELIKLHHCEHPSATVIFIHGLDGDPWSTWGFDRSESWLSWLLSSRNDVAVWTLKYRLSASWWFGGSMPLADRAINTLAIINEKIDKTSPIVLVAHSYGGLLAKQLVRAGNDTAREFDSVSRRVAGIIFFATPNQGSQIASYIKAFARVFSKISIFARFSPAVRELKHNAPALRDLNLWFRGYVATHKILIKCYHETLPVNGAVIVVDEASSDPGLQGVTSIPIDADHLTICKPTRRNFCASDLIDIIQQSVVTQEAAASAKTGAPEPPTRERDRFDGLKDTTGSAGDPSPDGWEVVERRVRQLTDPSDTFKIEDA